MSDAAFVCCSVIEFGSGDPSVMLLGRGTREECEKIADLLPAVCYSGDRTIAESYLVVTEAENYVELPPGAVRG